MDKEQAINIAKTYSDEIKKKYDILSIYLFGSFAKGNESENSDIDLAIVLKTNDNILDTQLDLMRLRRNIDLRIEPHPYTELTFDVSDPVVNEILKHGLAL
jgi:predicted nucleotidyltransferase